MSQANAVGPTSNKGRHFSSSKLSKGILLHVAFVCSICTGQFISDATYPDNSCVAPGIMLNKSWIVRNTGSVPWTPTTTKVECFWGCVCADTIHIG